VEGDVLLDSQCSNSSGVYWTVEVVDQPQRESTEAEGAIMRTTLKRREGL
jgi:hypothetical protein